MYSERTRNKIGTEQEGGPPEVRWLPTGIHNTYVRTLLLLLLYLFFIAIWSMLSPGAYFNCKPTNPSHFFTLGILNFDYS